MKFWLTLCCELMTIYLSQYIFNHLIFVLFIFTGANIINNLKKYIKGIHCCFYIYISHNFKKEFKGNDYKIAEWIKSEPYIQLTFLFSSKVYFHIQMILFLRHIVKHIALYLSPLLYILICNYFSKLILHFRHVIQDRM